MKILVACEFSGRVRDAFRDRGNDAWSCDLENDLNNSKYHIKTDVLNIIKDGWDLLIGHPPCTYLTRVSARWLYKKGKIDNERYQKGLQAKEFFMQLYNADIKHICIENPIPLNVFNLPVKTQVIHPFQFGHKLRKSTQLWLRNLPLLQPTNIVKPEHTYINKNGKKIHWYDSISQKNNGITRQQIRSITFNGIAAAMAEQWGNEIKNYQIRLF